MGFYRPGNSRKDQVTGKEVLRMAETLMINQRTMNSRQMESYLLTEKRNRQCRK